MRRQAANSSETIGSKDGGKASSDVGGWAPERSRASQAESEMGSIISAPDMYPEDSVLIEDLVVSWKPTSTCLAADCWRLGVYVLL